jgi:phosphatidylglycerol:prolipoprotein diacylglycerol transferase
MFPKLLSFHSFVLPTYGLLVAAGFVAGLAVAVHLAQREGLPKDQIYNLGIYIALAGMIGAKLFLLFQDREYYWEHPREIFSLSTLQSGGIFYGGLLTAIAVAMWYARRSRIPFLKMADAFSPGIALGHAFGRLGCFAAGCCWGNPTSLPWGVTFTNSYSNEVVGVPLGIPLHPTQLYEAAAEAAIFAALYLGYRRKRFDGQILGWYLLLYPTARFLVEFLRSHVGEAVLWGGAISDAQAISLLLILLGVWLLWLSPASRSVTLLASSGASSGLGPAPHSHGNVASHPRSAANLPRR